MRDRVTETFHEQSHSEWGPISLSINGFCSHHWARLQEQLVARGVVSLAEDRQPWGGSPVRNKLMGGLVRECLPQSSAGSTVHREGPALHCKRELPFETQSQYKIVDHTPLTIIDFSESLGQKGGQLSTDTSCSPTWLL